MSDRSGVSELSDPLGREVPAPRASRLPRPRWLDPRLLIGLVLVLASVALGAQVIAQADNRVQVWSVTRDLGAGVRLTDADVTPVAVRLDELGARYAGADEDISGFVLTRPLGEGELLPVGALRPAEEVEQRRVVLEVDRVGVAGLGRGSVVDVYRVLTANGQVVENAEPELVLSGVSVAEDIRGSGSGFGSSGSTVGVALMVDQADVQTLLTAVANGTIYLVSVPK